MKVLINGIGNIGQTLISLLLDYKELLGIDTIYALKNTAVTPFNRQVLDILSDEGVTICTHAPSEFQLLGNVIDDVDYIFDCCANTFGLKNKVWYDDLKNLKGACAQGSEKGFGLSFMSGINDDRLKGKRYAHIVSCNTHSLASIIASFTFGDFDRIVEGDFVVVRRSEDIGNKQRLVGANVVSRHLDQQTGTHHAIDVKDLFSTIDMSLDIQSSDITTPSQLMHTVRFDLKMRKLPSQEEIDEQLLKEKSISTTSKYDSNIVFELGRRYSPYGRLYSQSIIVSNNLLWDIPKNRVKGWAFIPQEGNTILSTIHAYLIQCNIEQSDAIMDTLKLKLISNQW